jgi:hypothetical protein
MNSIWFYLIYLWHKHITSEAFLITFTHENNIGETLVTVNGDKIQILWEKEKYYEGYRKCYKYWARYTS